MSPVSCTVKSPRCASLPDTVIPHTLKRMTTCARYKTRSNRPSGTLTRAPRANSGTTATETRVDAIARWTSTLSGTISWRTKRRPSEMRRSPCTGYESSRRMRRDGNRPSCLLSRLRETKAAEILGTLNVKICPPNEDLGKKIFLLLNTGSSQAVRYFTKKALAGWPEKDAPPALGAPRPCTR